jgi:hypothetical protein
MRHFLEDNRVHREVVKPWESRELADLLRTKCPSWRRPNGKIQGENTEKAAYFCSWNNINRGNEEKS